MTTTLSDLCFALDHHILQQAHDAPAACRDYADANAKPERADVFERLLTVDSDREGEALVRRWLKAYSPCS